MKISVITQFYKPEMGAPQNRLLEMCIGLKNLGVDVSVITALPNYPTGKIFDGYKGRFSCIEQLDDIPILRYWIYASNSRKVMPRIWSMLSLSMTILCSLRYLRKRRNDIIIVNSPPLPLTVSAWLLSRLSGSKVIMNVSDLWPLAAKEMGVLEENSIVYKLLTHLEKFLYKHCDACMGQSNEIVDYVATHGAKQTYLFRNGVDPTRFTHIEPPKNLHESLRIVYAGLLGYAQGILDVCRQMDFASLNAEFHIYGAGGEQADIEQYISEHPEKGIIYHGKVSREEIPHVLAQNDCTLIPLAEHIYGAVPSKIYESMAAGLPILFAGEGEGARIIEENQLGWVSKSKDFEALANNIRLATNKKSREEMRAHCIDCAHNKFNRPQQVRLLHDFLLQLLHCNHNK